MKQDNVNLIHVSNNKIDNFKFVDPGTNVIPHGIRYILEDTFNKVYSVLKRNVKMNYKYEIIPKLTTIKIKDNKRVLQINTDDDFDEFMKSYGYIDNKKVHVHWSRVSNDFAGVQVIPLITSRLIVGENVANFYTRFDINIDKYQPSWIHFWKYPSGVVWNRDAIEHIKFIDNLSDIQYNNCKQLKIGDSRCRNFSKSSNNKNKLALPNPTGELQKSKHKTYQLQRQSIDFLKI